MRGFEPEGRQAKRAKRQGEWRDEAKLKGPKESRCRQGSSGSNLFRLLQPRFFGDQYGARWRQAIFQDISDFSGATNPQAGKRPSAGPPARNARFSGHTGASRARQAVIQCLKPLKGPPRLGARSKHASRAPWRLKSSRRLVFGSTHGKFENLVRWRD